MSLQEIKDWADKKFILWMEEDSENGKLQIGTNLTGTKYIVRVGSKEKSFVRSKCAIDYYLYFCNDTC